MAENDNTDRPRSNGSQGTPEKSFSTNNVRSSSENYSNNNSSNQTIIKSDKSKPTTTPTKKGK